MVNSFTVFDGAGAPSDEATAGEGERSWGAGMASGVHDAFARGGEVGVGLEEERGIDEDKDPGLGLGCLNVNVESVEGMGDRDWSLEKEE